MSNELPGWLALERFEPEPGISLRYARVEPDGSPVATTALLPGRAEFIEKYIPVLAALRRRGHRVWILDWRGQGLSSRLLDDRHKGHVGDYSDYMRDLEAWLWRVVQAAPGVPRFLMGHSMGGHLGLRLLADSSRWFEAGIFTAPMLALRGPLPDSALRPLARLAVAAGRGEAYAPGAAYDPLVQPFEGNLLTRDPDEFERDKVLMRANPMLATGGITCGWLDATLRSLAIFPGDDALVRRLSAPCLLVCAGEDKRVDNRGARKVAALAADIRLEVIPDAEHEILIERPEIRRAFWDAFDRFVAGRFRLSSAR